MIRRGLYMKTSICRRSWRSTIRADATRYNVSAISCGNPTRNLQHSTTLCINISALLVHLRRGATDDGDAGLLYTRQPITNDPSAAKHNLGAVVRPTIAAVINNPNRATGGRCRYQRQTQSHAQQPP